MILKAANDWKNTVPVVIVDVDECEKNVEEQKEEHIITIQDIEENDNTSLPNAEDVRELLRTAKTEINKLSNYLYGKPDRPSDLIECGRIDGEYAVWDKILYILRPM